LRVRGLLLLAVLIGIIVWLLPWNKYFAIKAIIIESERVGADTVKSLIGIEVGDNILRANLGAARRNLLALPWAREVKIKRVFPNRLKVIIKEREPFAIIFIPQRGYFWIDHEGYLLEEIKEKKAGLFVSGVELVKEQTKERVTEVATAAIGDLFTQDKEFLERFTELRLGKEEAVLLAHEGFQVKLPLENLGSSLRLLQRILRQIDGSKYRYIDMRFGDLILMPR